MVNYIPYSIKPWHRVHMDFASPFLSKMFYILVVAHLKWPEFLEMSATILQLVQEGDIEARLYTLPPTALSLLASLPLLASKKIRMIKFHVCSKGLCLRVKSRKVPE